MHRADETIAGLWRTLQSMPQYRGTTALLVTTDHGRGGGTRDWRHHQPDIAGSDEIGLAALGPGVPALDKRANIGERSQSKVAATIAQLLGFDWSKQRSDAEEALCFEPGQMAQR